MFLKVYKIILSIIGGWYLGQFMALVLIKILQYFKIEQQVFKFLDLITLQQ